MQNKENTFVLSMLTILQNFFWESLASLWLRAEKWKLGSASSALGMLFYHLKEYLAML